MKKNNFDNNGYEIVKSFYSNHLITEILKKIETDNEKILNFISSDLISKNDYAVEGNEIKYLKNPQFLFLKYTNYYQQNF